MNIAERGMELEILNEVNIVMDAKSENESFARIVAAGFIAALDPTMNELNEVKTAVSEAVTNAVIHGYDKDSPGKITLNLTLDTNNTVTIVVSDKGKGILNIEEARSPLYTSKPEMERSGMGFTVMEMFMDSTRVTSEENVGTTIIMTKKIGEVGSGDE